MVLALREEAFAKDVQKSWDHLSPGAHIRARAINRATLTSEGSKYLETLERKRILESESSYTSFMKRLTMLFKWSGVKREAKIYYLRILLTLLNSETVAATEILFQINLWQTQPHYQWALQGSEFKAYLEKVCDYLKTTTNIAKPTNSMVLILPSIQKHIPLDTFSPRCSVTTLIPSSAFHSFDFKKRPHIPDDAGLLPTLFRISR